MSTAALCTEDRGQAENTSSFLRTTTHTTMSDNNNDKTIIWQNDWITVERNSDTGRIRATVESQYSAPRILEIPVGRVMQFSNNRVVLRDDKLGSWTFVKGKGKSSLEEQAVHAARIGYLSQLRAIINDDGLPENSVLPSSQKTLLQEACSVGTDNSACIRLLLDLGDPMDYTLNDHDSILHLLARHGTLEQWYHTLYCIGDGIANKLLFRRNSLGDTPLHVAAKRGDIGIYTLIVALSGPYNEIRLKNNEGKTPCALFNENCEVLKQVVMESISDEDRERIKHDELCREELFTNARQDMELEYMSDFICNSIFRDALYDAGDPEDEES